MLVVSSSKRREAAAKAEKDKAEKKRLELAAAAARKDYEKKRNAEANALHKREKAAKKATAVKSDANGASSDSSKRTTDHVRGENVRIISKLAGSSVSHLDNVKPPPKK